MSVNQLNQGITTGLNTASVTSVIGTFMGWIPTTVSVIAGILTSIWMIFQLLENKKFIACMRWIKEKIS